MPDTYLGPSWADLRAVAAQNSVLLCCFKMGIAKGFLQNDFNRACLFSVIAVGYVTHVGSVLSHSCVPLSMAHLLGWLLHCRNETPLPSQDLTPPAPSGSCVWWLTKVEASACVRGGIVPKDSTSLCFGPPATSSCLVWGESEIARRRQLAPRSQPCRSAGQHWLEQLLPLCSLSWMWWEEDKRPTESIRPESPPQSSLCWETNKPNPVVSSRFS